MSNRQALEVLQAARVIAARVRPYLSSAVYALTWVEREGIGTYGVDKYWRLYYDPEKALEWGVKTSAAVLLHEVAHVLRKHHDRALRKCPSGVGGNAVNICEDMEINDDHKQDLNRELPLPKDAFYPSTLGLKDGRLWEEYFDQLDQQGKIEHIQINTPCGSGATGQPAPWDAPPPPSGAESKDGQSVGKKGEKPDQGQGQAPEGLSDAESEMVRKQVAKEIQEYGSQSRGTVPAGWQRWAGEVLKPPRVDWRRELPAALRITLRLIAGAVDYTYRRPGRRSSAMPDIVTPALRRPIPYIAEVIDTSGSMSDRQLKVAIEETEGVCRALGATVKVFSVDADVHGVQEVQSARSIKLKGGGGTDMRIGIDAACELRPRPDAVIVFTDGYTPWPSEQPPCRLIICLIGNKDTSGCPSWARVVVVDADGDEDDE